MPDAQTVLIAGGSGVIGTELARQLREAGHTALVLVRRPAQTPFERSWDPEARWLRVGILDGVDAVVNLSGASISRLPWTLQYKREILQSRIGATATLVDAMAKAETPPRVFISGSAVGYYGDRPGEILTEESAPGDGFLAKVCVAWERAAAPASAHSRVVYARTGLVLGEQGALKPIRMLAKLGLAGPLGDGRQHWPWISLFDEAAALRHLIETEVAGPMNLVAPGPVPAGEIIREVAEDLGRPYWLPAPAWAIKLGLADAGRELLLADQDVSSARLTESGFEFRDTTVPEALAAV
ncbi:TIGR01777 family oxidoreductase [Cnuibacter sp. UC19_7]|uniref:TIGR01777 family oxidoreductase n=1 Tax=Cnuibacter sp. UC19_7 TaxID=3350166 RepID=UPI00366FE1C2